MDAKVYELDHQHHAALVKADFSVVQCLLQDDAAWGVETLRLAGIPEWICNMFAWAGKLYPARMLPGIRAMFWAQFGVGRRPALAYRIERVADDCIRITPTAPVTPGWNWLLLVGLGLLMPVLLHARSRQVRERSARMMPAFCQYLLARLQK